MAKKHKILLLIDGIINIILGIIILLFPFGVDKLLGVPHPDSYFYSTILGAIIFGIGASLIIEICGFERNIRGLGLSGAIVLNIIGASALLVWLIIDPFDIPLRGYIILWSLAVLVLSVGIVEIILKSWRY